jgi:GntR family transcriptional regulator, rspAB operon transcriptional repressor
VLIPAVCWKTPTFVRDIQDLSSLYSNISVAPHLAYTLVQKGEELMAELLRDSVYRALRHAVLTCEFQPGQELREQVLAEKYRVSRSPIRDSLLRLEQEKLVTVLPRQGYRVNPISPRDVEDLFGLRLIIAPACAAGAARADHAAVRSLDRFRNVIGDDVREAEFLEYNRDFHCTLADMAGNARLAAVERSLVEEFDRLVVVGLQVFQTSGIPDVCAEHDAILDAVQTHDSDAAYRLARDHIARGLTRIRIAVLKDAEESDRSAAELHCGTF